MAKNPSKTPAADALQSASGNPDGGKDSSPVSNASPVAAREAGARVLAWHAALPAGLMSDDDRDRLVGLVRKAPGAQHVTTAIDIWYEGYFHRATHSGSPLISVDDKAALDACAHVAASTPEQE